MDVQQQNEPVILGPRKHWCAISSLEFGIISVCCLPILYSSLLVLTIILLAIILLLSLLGFILGVAGLVIAYRPASPYAGVRQAWIGCLLCVITFGVAGLSWASAMDYWECATDQRTIMDGLEMYVQDNNGLFPSSLTALAEDMPPGQLYCHKHYFYWLYTTSPYILNGYLAGIELGDFAFPERTLLIAVGKDPHAKLFFKRSDMDLSNNRAVAFPLLR